MEEVLGFVGDEEVSGVDNSKRPPKCNYCKEMGHNSTTCKVITTLCVQFTNLP